MPANPTPNQGPTLLELLEHAARDYDHLENPMGPVVPYEPACRDMSERLRDAARRLREEMERAPQERMTWAYIGIVLERINGGPCGPLNPKEGE